MYFAFCTIHIANLQCAFSPFHHALFTMCYAQCLLHLFFCWVLFCFVLRTRYIQYALYAMYYSIFTMHDALYAMHFAICTRHYSLCTLRFAFALNNTWSQPTSFMFCASLVLLAILVLLSSYRALHCVGYFFFFFFNSSMECKLYSRLQYKSHVRIGFDLSIGNMNQEWEPEFFAI